ncbi:hypothetical protein CGRA01v4_07508 [Colletotrichum graminicola]|nr:hypothetical protein CGRA01v4_07508 [Colletotrichum graminicola]
MPFWLLAIRSGQVFDLTVTLHLALYGLPPSTTTMRCCYDQDRVGSSGIIRNRSPHGTTKNKSAATSYSLVALCRLGTTDSADRRPIAMERVLKKKEQEEENAAVKLDHG